MARTKATARYRHKGMVPRLYRPRYPQVNAHVESRVEDEEIETRQEQEQEHLIATGLTATAMNGIQAPPTTPVTPRTPKTVEKQRFVDPAYSDNDGSLESTCLRPEFKMMTPRKRTSSRAIRHDQVRRRLFDERPHSQPEPEVQPNDLNLGLYHFYNYPASVTRSGKVYQRQF